MAKSLIANPTTQNGMDYVKSLENLLNTKKKDLLNSKIILNMDFPEEILNKFRLPQKSVIINLSNEINIKTKQFNGININYYNIYMKDKYKLQGFNDVLIYEALIYDLKKDDASEKILKDKIRYRIFYRK